MEVSAIFTAGAIIISLATMLVVRLIRGGIELIKADTTQKPVWKKLLLPLLAIVVGAGLGMLTSVVPVGLAGSVADRLLFGGMLGGLSTIVWRALAAVVKAKYGVALDSEEGS